MTLSLYLVMVYSIALLVIIFLIFTAYIKIKYKFWSVQPVMHFYDLQYWFYKKGIICGELPAKNKYCNFKNIETIKYDRVSDSKMTDSLYLIQTNYLRNKDNVFLPSIQNIAPYFKGHHGPTFWTLYWIDSLVQDKTGIIQTKTLAGMITSRPLHVSIYKNGEFAQFDIYYIDYLSVHKNQRKKGIAPELIQTHEYNQSHLNLKIQTSLFKRENELTGIVPLCVYDTYIFSMKGWNTPIHSNVAIKLVPCGKENVKYILPLLSDNRLFDITIVPDLGNLLELIVTNNIIGYMLIYEDEVVAVYFFRDSCVQIEKDKKAITLFASIYNNRAQCILHNKESRAYWLSEFIHGFKISLSNICSESASGPFHFLVIESVGTNHHLVDNLLLKSSAYSVSPSAYFFYNFAYPTFNPNNVLIVN